MTHLSWSRPNPIRMSPGDRDSKDRGGNRSIVRECYAKTPDDRDSKGHRGNDSTGNRDKGDEIKDGDKGHQS